MVLLAVLAPLAVLLEAPCEDARQDAIDAWLVPHGVPAGVTCEQGKAGGLCQDNRAAAVTLCAKTCFDCEGLDDASSSSALPWKDLSPPSEQDLSETLQRCEFATRGDGDMACRHLESPFGVVAVTYDPKLEWISQQKGNYLQDHFDVLKRESREGVALDIGANMGLFTLSAAALGHSVVAFEPSTANLKRLYASLFVNGFAHRVDVEQVALGSTPGTSMLYLNPDSEDFKSDGVLMPRDGSAVFEQVST